MISRGRPRQGVWHEKQPTPGHLPDEIKVIRHRPEYLGPIVMLKPTRWKVINKDQRVRAGPVYPGHKLDVLIPVGTVLYPRHHLPIAINTTVLGLCGLGGHSNTILNFYLVDFVSHDGITAMQGWLTDYSPANRMRALAIKYRAPPRPLAENEAFEVPDRPTPRGELVVGEGDACFSAERTCGGFF